ncbi:LptM family lipoprotein [Pseudoalteromonas nigrifaciens]|uniref:LptM family lipoprotein n=1 Tax=Pseudoalteromonas nigrifaciens TaxID=28109 RepID=UPI00356623CD
MKSFKLALLAMTTALILQGCGSDSDSDESPTSQPDQPDVTQPDQPNIDTEIVGMWSSDDTASGELSTIIFMDDGTYIQTQVDSSQSTSEAGNGMELGSYSVSSTEGKLTATPIFDKNGTSGLSDSVMRYAQVSNGKLILKADENGNGIIDSNESYRFSETKSEGILGPWDFDDADDNELLGLAFLENGTYIYVQVDEDGSVDNSENGMEWGNYTVDAVTDQLTTTIIYDDNAGTGLSEPRTRYARVTGNTALTIEVDDNQDDVIDNEEMFKFSRP